MLNVLVSTQAPWHYVGEWGGEVYWCYWLDVKLRLLNCSRVCVCVCLCVCVLPGGISLLLGREDISRSHWDVSDTTGGMPCYSWAMVGVCLPHSAPAGRGQVFSTLFPGIGRGQAVIVWRFPALTDFPFPGPLATASRLLFILNLFCLCWYAGFFKL